MKKILALLVLSAFSSVVFAQESTSATESNAVSGSTAESNAQGGTGVGYGGAATTGPSTSSVTVNFPTQPTTTTQNVNSAISGGTTNTNTNNNTDNITSKATVDSTSKNTNTNNNTDNITSNSTNKTTVDGTTTQNIVASGGTNNRTDVHYSGSFKTVPNVYAPPVGVTAPCIVGWSGGISVIGVGVSAGKGVEDKECTNRENARMLQAFGEVKGAVSLLCQNKNVYKAMQERCDLAQAKETPPAQTTTVVTPPVETPPVTITEEKATRHSSKKVGG